MNIGTYVCSACTTGSIASLGVHASAKEAMREFCRLALGATRYSSLSRSVLETYYVFTAGPEKSGYGHSKYWVKYGTEFAEFILENKLGEIATLPKRRNLKYHPDTDCQTWLWAPDQTALEAWYAKNRKE